MKDLLMVDAVDETHVVDELIRRYRQGYVYTFLGPVLIAMNPYKVLKQADGSSIYARNMIDEFSGKEMHLAEPHPFAIAESAYSNLMRFGTDQSLLITGESGSGKTETSKHVMQYLTTISTRSRAKSAVIANRRMSVAQKKEADEMTSHVTDVLWGSNPVLEAFGNAQTIRNNNSSRFGKYIVLQMNRLGQVIGGYIDNYLLERSRIIHQAEGERNFHAFYQLLAGASDAERTKWHLEPAEHYEFLSHEHATIDGVDDAAEFPHLVANLTAVGITRDEQDAIFQQLAAILWIGNIHFRETTDEYHNKIAALADDDARHALNIAAELLGVEATALESMLTFRIVNIYREDQRVLFDARQAKKVCHSIARTMYENIFNWLVARINVNAKVANARVVANSIGILDIYGFEIFDVNMFEQLCINYVNEKLQQLFIMQTLQTEQEEYRREGLSWQNVTFFNNQVVCDLIEDPKTHGIFPLLDEQCAIARLSDLELIERYNASHSRNAHYVKSRIQGPHFSIVHYAGKVEYDVTLFFEANVDTFFNDLHAGLAASTNAFVRDVFNDTRSSEEKKKRPPSTSQQFRAQVNTLVKTLDGCDPHYIRCIKPNEKKQPLVVNPTIIAEQVKYLGLVENLSVRRQGFCYSETYATFLKRYKFLSGATWPRVKAHSTRKAAIDLLTSPNMGVMDNETQTLVPFVEDSKTLGCFSLGRNRIFLRHPQALSALEVLRDQKIPVLVQTLEHAWRRYKNRIALTKFIAADRELRAAYTAVTTNCLDRRARRVGANDKAQTAQLYATWNALASKLLAPESSRLIQTLAAAERDNSVIFCQSFVRAASARRSFLRLKRAQIVFSKRYRGLKTRKQLVASMWQSCRTALLGVRTEFERYMGLKKRRRNTLDRVYKGDYIGVNTYPAYAQLLKSKATNGTTVGHTHQKLLFLGHVQKVNERFVHQPRVLMIGTHTILNLKADKVHQPKERRAIELTKLAGVAMSTQPDNYLLLQVKNDADLLVVVEQKTEIVNALRKRILAASGRELRVTIADTLEFVAVKGKPVVVKFQFDRSMSEGVASKIDRKTMLVKVGII